MNSRERFFAAVNHQQPDRVPLDFWARPEVHKAMQEHFGLSTRQDVLLALGADIVTVELDEQVPGWREKASILPGDTFMSGQPVIFRDERTFEDQWGIVRRIDEEGKYLEWVDGPLAQLQDVADYDWPDPGKCFPKIEKLATQIRLLKNDFCVFGRIHNTYKMAWCLRGLENLLCDLLVNRSFAEQLYQKVCAFETARAVNLARAGVDVIQVNGDIAMKDRLMFPPHIWRDLDGPLMRELIRRVREVNPDIIMAFHSDGQMEEALPYLIDWGFKIINPIQPECMDPEQIKRKYGRQITLHGTMSIVNLLRTGTVQQVRDATEQRIQRCGYDGGLILGPTNETQWDVPIDNLLAMYETAKSVHFGT